MESPPLDGEPPPPDGEPPRMENPPPDGEPPPMENPPGWRTPPPPPTFAGGNNLMTFLRTNVTVIGINFPFEFIHLFIEVKIEWIGQLTHLAELDG